MKKIIYLAVGLLVFTFTPIFGKANGAPTPHADSYQERLRAIVNAAASPQKEPPELTKFNLDFPGGTPAELVKAIEKATGKPLNVIIPTEDADVQLPPLKMNHVDVAQLFKALGAATATKVHNPYIPNSFFQAGCSFRSMVSGVPTDSSIWYFYNDVPLLPQKICRFYSLAAYLDRGFTVDDITTAIQTGWKMAGVTSPPELDYHKETKLLIAFGEPDQLKTIDSVLSSLPSSNSTIGEISQMNAQINTLTKEVYELKKKVSAPAPVSKEKSGK